MNKRQKLQQKIKELQGELDNLKEWPLPERTDHWTCSEAGSEFQPDFLMSGNVDQALSEKRAIQLYEKQRLMQDMYLWVDIYCPDWEPDWSDCEQRKYGVSILEGICGIDYNLDINAFVFGISVPAEELAGDMREEFEDRINKWY